MLGAGVLSEVGGGGGSQPLKCAEAVNSRSNEILAFFMYTNLSQLVRLSHCFLHLS